MIASMSFRVDDLPDPENRTAAHWVTYYLRLENAVAQGETVTVNGRSVSMPDLETIVARRRDWEKQIDRDAQAASGVNGYAPIYLG